MENIIRIGSAGSYSPQAKVFDVVLATSAYSESSYAKTQNGYDKDVTYPSEALCGALRKSAARLGMPLIEGAVHSSDVFYRDAEPDYWEKLRDEKGCLAVEMESFALFHNAAATKKNAACLLTISDSFVSHEETTAEQRQTSFTNMMEIALFARCVKGRCRIKAAGGIRSVADMERFIALGADRLGTSSAIKIFNNEASGTEY